MSVGIGQIYVLYIKHHCDEQMHFVFWVAYVACTAAVAFVVILILTQRTRKKQQTDTTTAQSDEKPLLGELERPRDATSSEEKADTAENTVVDKVDIASPTLYPPIR
jgi:mannitol-specific phosphotransferase system IIBC component